MKRFALAAILLLALPSLAADKWWDSYKRGIDAVTAKDYRTAANALQAAIAEMPNEGTGVRTRNGTITYLPHFWLGIAKFNLGDVDGALREWKLSEEQGAIVRTEHYARLKEWMGRAQVEKQREAENASAGARKAADTAISKALADQVGAVSAGADRSESYRAAQRKLQEALGHFKKAGNDISVYRTAQQAAEQASSGFRDAAEVAKKEKAALAANAAKPKPQQPTPVRNEPKPVAAQVITPPPVQVTEQKPAETTLPPPVPVETEAQVAARIAIQDYRRKVAGLLTRRGLSRDQQKLLSSEAGNADTLRKQLESAADDGERSRIARTAADRAADLDDRLSDLAPVRDVPVVEQKKIELQDAWRAYASGDLDTAEAMLSSLAESKPAAEVFLLRGCTRYTRATLTRDQSLLDQARRDFKEAIGRKKSIRLDATMFSPKMLAFFEEVRKGG
jgi:tetratricopeptide (TPR) repeat protein